VQWREISSLLMTLVESAKAMANARFAVTPRLPVTLTQSGIIVAGVGKVLDGSAKAMGNARFADARRLPVALTKSGISVTGVWKDSFDQKGQTIQNCQGSEAIS